MKQVTQEGDHENWRCHVHTCRVQRKEMYTFRYVSSSSKGRGKLTLVVGYEERAKYSRLTGGWANMDRSFFVFFVPSKKYVQNGGQLGGSQMSTGSPPHLLYKCWMNQQRLTMEQVFSTLHRLHLCTKLKVLLYSWNIRNVTFSFSAKYRAGLWYSKVVWKAV